MQNQEQQKAADKNEGEAKSNLEDFGLKIVISADEQRKILAQIQQEESIDAILQQKKEEDAIYLEDEPEKALEKLLTLSQCPVQERSAYVKHLCELVQFIGLEKIDKLPAIVEQILMDSDEVKKVMISQFELLIDYLKAQDHGVTLIKSYLLPTLLSLLKNNNFDIKTDTTRLIAAVAGLLSIEDREQIILKEIISISHDEQNEQNKRVALQFFGATAKVLGRESVERFIAHELISAGEDERYLVRKESIYQLPAAAQVASKEFFNAKLLPFFLSKCEDRSNWQIRKACAEKIVEMSEISPFRKREIEISKTMLALLRDGNRYVRAAAYLNLGPFIETLRECTEKNDQLLVEFCKCTSKEIHEYYDTDANILEPTAFNFPAVLKTYGPAKWPALHKLLCQLIKHSNKNVRKPLACSLHEIAKVVGTKIAEKDLISLLDGLLKEQCEEVKCGAAQNLWEFLKIFDQEQRDNLLDIFVLLQRDFKKWRIRELLARQIKHLITLYSPDNIFQIIFPITMKLCNDIVSVVRRQAAKQMYSILLKLNSDEESRQAYLQCLVENIKAVSASNRYNQRQAFVYMCQNLMKMDEFEVHFLESFACLCQDPVRNVRITVAQVIVKHLKKKGKYHAHPAIQRMISYLEKDKELEVQLLMKQR